MSNPLVSIIIVNWNGKFYLEKCIKSLSKVTYKPVEIIIVDQSSTDGSVELVKKKFSKVRLIENKENTGYVGGNNLGVSKAKGKYILILNNDIEVEKNFLEPLVEAFESDKSLGVAQPKAINLRYKNKLDGGGSYITPTGFLFHKGYLESANKKEFNERYPVYSVKGAYMMTRRDLFEKLGGLDHDFFIYFEESDYCGRVWVAGYTVEYIPTSVVYHWGGGDTKEDWDRRFALIQYRSFKNRICSYIKNLSDTFLILILPIHIVICFALIIYYTISRNFNVSWSLARAIAWNIINFDSTLGKREQIQSIRKTSDFEIFKKVGKIVTPFYYLHQMKFLKIK